MTTLIDTGAASLATGIPPTLLRSWIHRGKLTHHGHDHQGRTLIDLDQIPEARQPRPSGRPRLSPE